MEEKEMSFWGHLEELRRTLFRVVAVLLVFMIACFCVMPDLFDSFVLGPTTSDFFLYRWLSNLGGTGMFLPDFSNDDFAVEIININVASQFLTHISTSFWFALVLMFPYLIFEVWRFVQPALFENERRSVGLAFLGGTVMFFLGCAVGYCLVFPFTFRFLTEYQLSASIVNQISLNSYMGNFLMLVFVMGIVFELPLLAWLLSKLGLVNKTFFRTYRRHAVVILLVLSAVITPSGDPFTLMVVFLPLYLLYELAFYIVDVAQYRIDLQPVEFPADEKRKAGHERVANVIHEQPYGIQLLFPKIACGLLGHIAVLGDDLIDALTRYLVYIGIAVEHAGNRCNRNA